MVYEWRIPYKNDFERRERHLSEITNYKKQYRYSLWRYGCYCIKKTRKRPHRQDYITDTLCSIPLNDKNTIETEIINWNGYYDVW